MQEVYGPKNGPQSQAQMAQIAQAQMQQAQMHMARMAQAQMHDMEYEHKGYRQQVDARGSDPSSGGSNQMGAGFAAGPASQMGAYPPMFAPGAYVMPMMGMNGGPMAYMPMGMKGQDRMYPPMHMGLQAGIDQWRDQDSYRPRDQDGSPKTRAKRRQRRRVEPVPPPRGLKVFVGGLGPQSSSDTLRNYFEQFGPVLDAAVLADSVTKRSRGFGFVEFADEIPPGVLGTDHIIGERRCGVREYDYNPEVA